MGFTDAGRTILLIGETAGHMGASIYLRDIEGRSEGAPPPVDLDREKATGIFIRGLITGGTITLQSEEQVTVTTTETQKL